MIHRGPLPCGQSRVLGIAKAPADALDEPVEYVHAGLADGIDLDAEPGAEIADHGRRRLHGEQGTRGGRVRLRSAAGLAHGGGEPAPKQRGRMWARKFEPRRALQHDGRSRIAGDLDEPRGEFQPGTGHHRVANLRRPPRGEPERIPDADDRAAGDR